MAVATDASGDGGEEFVPPATRFLSANGNVVRYDFDGPSGQRVVGIEGERAHIVAVVAEDAPAETFEEVLEDLSTELGYAAGEDVDP